ncbi:MAG: hypothetical protein LUO79_00050 [Methanomassiliicoccales archaeon]|nr:hypothetical protein [Methanomassiliicoccales archaeon]
MPRRGRRQIACDCRGVAGFQETLVAALVITIATMILLAGIGRAISSDSEQRAEARRSSEIERLLVSIRSCSAFEDGVLDISMAGAISNETRSAVGTFAGARVTLDLVLGDGAEIELGRCGAEPRNVTEVESRSIPMEVRMSANHVTAGLLVVSLWWE